MRAILKNSITVATGILISVLLLTVISILGIYRFQWQSGLAFIVGKQLPLPAASVGGHNISLGEYLSRTQYLTHHKLSSKTALTDLRDQQYVLNYASAHNIVSRPEKTISSSSSDYIHPSVSPSLILKVQLAVSSDKNLKFIAKDKAIRVLADIRSGKTIQLGASSSKFPIGNALNKPATPLEYLPPELAKAVGRADDKAFLAEPVALGNGYALVQKDLLLDGKTIGARVIVINVDFQTWLAYEQQTVPFRSYVK